MNLSLTIARPLQKSGALCGGTCGTPLKVVLHQAHCARTQQTTHSARRKIKNQTPHCHPSTSAYQTPSSLLRFHTQGQKWSVPCVQEQRKTQHAVTPITSACARVGCPIFIPSRPLVPLFLFLKKGKKILEGGVSRVAPPSFNLPNRIWSG